MHFFCQLVIFNISGIVIGNGQQFTTLGDYLSRCVNTEKPKMPMPIQKQKYPAESQETQQGRLPKNHKPLSNSVRFFHQSMLNFLTSF